jgi:DNA mismatch endonuclease (patch repair protein)
MRQQRSRDTAPEMALRRELFRRGYRFRVDHAVLGRRRRADIAFTRRRVAVFVDGCFWHSCPEHGTSPVSNSGWWEEKLTANVRRDRESEQELAAHGWVVLRVWEHEPVADAADRVCAVLASGSAVRSGDVPT